VGERLELEDRKGWDNIDADTFQGKEADLKRLQSLKKDAINFLRSIEDNVLKVKMQGTHEKHLREGGLDEFQIERDFKTGLKRVTTVQDKDVTVSGKAYIQDSIDQYRKLLHKGLASLELL
jgi:hypothetical protein